MTGEGVDNVVLTAILGMKSDIGEIKANTENIKDTLDTHIETSIEKMSDHDKRIEILENDKRIEVAKKNWFKEHPIRTGVTVCGVSLTTLLAIAGVLLKFVFGVL